MKRRHVLLHAAGAISLTAGCLSTSDTPAETTTSTRDSPPTSSIQPTAETTTKETATTKTTRTTVEPKVETLSEAPPENDVDCDDESLYTVSWGDRDSYPDQSNEFELKASTESLVFGDEITFTLTNVGSEEQEIAEIYQYNIQYREDGSWTPIYHTPDPLWTELAIRVAPGGGYEWPFTFNREGLERQHGPHNPPYHVCSALEPGTYRFVFWGLDEPLSRRFTVEEA